ncbi:MAG: hypothetical protein PHT69_08910 [Bacteroidales bacterium]|nr:hypothetical protein [Bacteroidales bacterium]
MNNPLQNKFKIQVEALSGFDFQDFIVELFLLKYGSTGFTVLRKKKDKGCDGIIVSAKQVIACYGPADNDQKKFDKKAEEDFEDFKNNWQSKFPNWMFVVNHEVNPAQVIKIETLKKGTPLVGIKGILSIIEELDSFQKRKMAKYLHIDSEFLAKDFLKEILDDLLKNSSSVEPRKEYNKPIYITDKVKLNFAEEEVQVALDEYDIVAEYFSDIQDLINGYEDDDIDKIKHRVVFDYSQTNGSFKERLNSLSNLYLGKYSNDGDDEYRFYVRALLIYIFEQCLIGIKTDTENDSTAS